MYCGKCGAARAEADAFCPQCGAAYADAAPAPAADDTPFGTEITIVAILLGFAMPFISLIVALVLRSGETRPSRRHFLKTWVIASGAWLCTGWIVALLAFSAIAGSTGSGGGCRSYSAGGAFGSGIAPCRMNQRRTASR